MKWKQPKFLERDSLYALLKEGYGAESDQDTDWSVLAFFIDELPGKVDHRE